MSLKAKRRIFQFDLGTVWNWRMKTYTAVTPARKGSYFWSLNRKYYECIPFADVSTKEYSRDLHQDLHRSNPAGTSSKVDWNVKLNEINHRRVKVTSVRKPVCDT